MKDHHQMVRDLLERGLQVERGKNHVKVSDGENTVVINATPGRGRGDRNAVAALRRAGMADPPSGGTAKRGRRSEVPVKPYNGPRLPPGRIPPRKGTE